jgi:hypothetical protein
MREKGMSKKWIEETIKNQTRGEIYDRYFRKLNDRLDVVRVFCLSEDPTNTLMWAHYGQNHYGVCIGLRAHQYNELPSIRIRGEQLRPMSDSYDMQFIPAVPVEYTNVRPKPHNVLVDDGIGFNRFILTKSNDWEYEKERRMIFPFAIIMNNPIKIALSQICEIVFGLRTPRIMEEKIIELTRNIKNLKYYKIIDSDDTFELIKMELA